MHHGKHYRRFNRSSSHRQHMLRNLTTSLIRYGRIRTTLPKAKELRPLADKMITLSKRGTPHAFTQIKAYLREHDIVIPRLKELAKHFQDRPGGYTRVLKAGFRQGDRAPMAYIELVGACGDQDLRYRTLLKAEAGRRLMRLSEGVSEPTTGHPNHAGRRARQELAIKRTEKLRQRVLRAQKMSEADWEAALAAEMEQLRLNREHAPK